MVFGVCRAQELALELALVRGEAWEDFPHCRQGSENGLVAWGVT